MSTLHYPDRIFSLSDCHGGQSSWHPLRSPDVAARLAEAIRSDLPGIQHFDTHGAPARFHDHVVREAVRLHRENPDADTTGLFINSAPRTKEHANGEPFYRAEFDEHLCIVATPLSVLSAVRSSVKKLSVLPNDSNGLYDGKKEQHRSSFTPRLLAENHGLRTEDVDPSLIPALPDGCSLAYIDRFGNLVLFEQKAQEVQSLRSNIAESVGKTLRLKVGRHDCYVRAGQSLAEAEPGTLIAYANDDSIEILRKWTGDWKLPQRFRRSAWVSFGKPDIGAECRVRAED